MSGSNRWIASCLCGLKARSWYVLHLILLGLCGGKLGRILTVSVVLPAAAFGGQMVPLTLLRPGDWKGKQTFCAGYEGNVAPCLVKDTDLEVIQKLVIEGYTVPADATQRNERLTPAGWVNVQEDPRRALSVGFPRPIARVEQIFVIPVFALPTVQFFQGESEAVSDLNVAIRYWQNGQEKQAYDLLTALVRRVSEFAADDPERALVYLVRGFLSLDRAVRLHAGQIQSEESLAFWRVRARGDFFKGMGEPDLSTFINAVDQTFDRDLYLDILKNAQFLEDGLGTPVRLQPIRIGDSSTHVLSWMRSVAPAVLFNLITLSRVQGQYGKAFTAAEKLEDLSVRMPGAYADLTARVLTVFGGETQPTMGKPVFLRPGHLNDLISLSYLVRAAASFRAKDPVRTLMYADETIRRSHSRSLAALGFVLFGNVYYDLRNLEWARRSYAWAELMDPFLLNEFPYALFWGAESAFWLGDLALSRRAFKDLRTKLSDRTFGPLVELRLLQLDLLGVKAGQSSAAAEQRMSYLRTHYSFAPVHQDVRVLDFCWNAKHYSSQLLQKEHAALLGGLKDAPLALREQAEACRLFAALELMKQDAGSLSGVQLDAAARRQLAEIEMFRKEFKESPYLRLVDQKVSLLKLSSVFADLEQNNCRAVVEFYQENEKELRGIAGDEGDRPVAGLRWTKDQMAQTIRCAAFLSLDPLWGRIRKEGTNEYSQLQELLLQLRGMSADLRARGKERLLQAATKLRDALLADSGWELFVNGVARADLASSALVGDPGFWPMLGFLELVEIEPRLDAADPFFEKPFRYALERVDLPKDALVCVWAYKALDSRVTPASVFQRRSLEPFQVVADWINVLDSSRGGEGERLGHSCRNGLVRKALKEVTIAPFPLGDSKVLWPYINHIGPLNEPEISMDLARRTFDRKEGDLERVVEVFQDIADNTKNDVYRSAAKRWLKEYNGGGRRTFW
jgi:hypothetical protein